ncbi:hypothetical protein BH23BAC1_BH23BAC1_24260 [soil metagenome]
MRKLTLSLLLIFSAFMGCTQNANVNKATRFQESGDLAQAKDAIDQAVQHDKTKDKGKTWYTKGLIYESIALAEDEDQRALADNAIEEAAEAYNKAKELEKENSPNYVLSEQRLEGLWGEFLNRGATAYQDGDYEEAVENFTKATTLKPEDTTAYLYGGIAAQQANKYDEALDHYYKLVDLGYNDVDIYSSIIFLERTHNEDNDKALEALRSARERFPENKDLLKEEINLLIITEKVDEARSKLQEAVAQEPDNATLHYNLGFLYDQTGDAEQAINSYAKAVEIDPEYFEANFNIAVNYYNKAAELLKQANNMDLKEYQKEGKPLEEKAKEHFRKSLPYLEKSRDLNPEDPTVLNTLRTVYTQLGMGDEADEVAQKLETIEGPSDDASN